MTTKSDSEPRKTPQERAQEAVDRARAKRAEAGKPSRRATAKAADRGDSGDSPKHAEG